jgi:hypothetical protein
MKIFLGLMLFSLSVFANGKSATPFKGYTEINRILMERVIGPGFSLGTYLGEPYVEAQPGTLLELLGMYETGGLSGGFANAVPNSLNTMLWALLLSGLADDIGGVCTGAVSKDWLTLTPDFQDALMPLCDWPKASATSVVALKTYWDALMFYDAPESEFEVWETFAEEEAKTNETAAVAVSRLTVAALLNPYFLLRN